MTVSSSERKEEYLFIPRGHKLYFEVISGPIPDDISKIERSGKIFFEVTREEYL